MYLCMSTMGIQVQRIFVYIHLSEVITNTVIDSSSTNKHVVRRRYKADKCTVRMIIANNPFSVSIPHLTTSLFSPSNLKIFNQLEMDTQIKIYSIHLLFKSI